MQEMLADSRVKRVCVMIDGPGETFDQVMENLSRPCRLAVEVCMKVNARSPEEVALVRERVRAVAQKSGNSLEFVEADAFDGRGDELSVDDAMAPQVIGQIAAPIFKKWGVARAWVFGSFASGWAHARFDIDLMVDLLPGVHLGYRYFDFRRELKEAFGRKVELHLPPYKPEGNQFLNVMERTKVLIYEDGSHEGGPREDL
ncbi:MAG: nucleotidyltransferase domain-containing protein [Atopobiaceae bacterium]|nr:nucleotidyltransferase domain-containing protein [Atopobiaceae bacterium]